jgi:hypothetical protein
MGGLFNTANARIRLHKVKDPPKTCTVMKEDGLLSRAEKQVWATERNSVIIDQDEVTVVNDLGQKICEWDKATFSALGNVSDFRFYIDEYKNFIYPYIEKKDQGVTMIKVPLQTCSLTDQRTVASFDTPKCDKPKKSGKRHSKKNKA